jgi:hypothetical protein
VAAHTGVLERDVTTVRYSNGKIRSYQSGAAMVAGLLFSLMAVTPATARPCLTKEEAKKLWPNEWLYWHTERHCWDHIKGTSGTYDERQPESAQQAANIVPAPLPKQVTTTKKGRCPSRKFSIHRWSSTRPIISKLCPWQ